MFNSRLLRFTLLFVLGGLAVLAPTAYADPLAAPMRDSYLSGCTGEYFNNTSLTGSPVMVRTDGAINFFWPENTSPGPGVAINNYSVRWTCSVNVPVSGSYNFNIVADDGMNVILDGNLLIWAWYDQGPTAYSATASIGAGWHTVRVEYYNRTLGGTAQVSSSISGGGPITDWKGDYFNNQTLSGSPTLTRNDGAINFNWGTGSPDPAIPVDHFSVRWTRTLYFSGGTWRFTTTTDDGVRLFVDGSLIIDKWIDQPPTSWSADMALGAGNHTVVMEYYENTGGAQAQLNYTPVSGPPPPPPPSGAWHGEYFNNVSLSGAPVYTHDDPAVNFNWGYGSPYPTVPVDNFSARWDSLQSFSTAGNYTITATSDDGVRVWVDGTLAVDGWSDHSSTTFTGTRYLTAGAHNIHVEYYERTGTALVSVQITLGTVPPPPPPGGDVIVDDAGPGWLAGGTAHSWHAAPVGIGGHAFWTFNSTYTAYGYNWARWNPALPAAGYYEVFAYLPASLGTTLNARYWIHHSGRYDLARRAQVFSPEQWVSLGTYYFTASGGEYVSLADVTYECYLCRTVAFDAVKFSPR